MTIEHLEQRLARHSDLLGEILEILRRLDGSRTDSPVVARPGKFAPGEDFSENWHPDRGASSVGPETHTIDAGRDKPSQRSTAQSVGLVAAIRMYLAYQSHEVSPQHWEVVRLTLEKFHQQQGNPSVGAIFPRHVAMYRESLREDGHLTRCSKTVNNHLAIISAFFAWTVQTGLRADNPATGLKLRNRGKASAERKAFTPEQIRDVFSGLTARTWASPSVPHFWLPIIMLYTGARPEEVAQLRVEDVKRYPHRAIEANEIGYSSTWVFDFSSMENGQRRKNEASRRLVPVHPRLWALGLENLCIDAGGGPLFPTLSPGSSNRLAEAPSRWFNRKWLRDVCGISDRKLVLYSLRHTVATRLKHLGYPENAISQLLGHTTSGMSGRYGKDYPIDELSKLVNALEWGV